MAQEYRIFGAELSPYSVKVRSYFRYKKIPHRWIVRDLAAMAEFEKYAKLPLIPLVVTPEDRGLQDSTPILDEMEARFPEPSIHPPDPALALLSAIVEEYADEWVNKPMFHYRWYYEPDRQSAAVRIARTMAPGTDGQELERMAESVRERMVPRLRFVGSNEKTKSTIERSFLRLLDLLDPHLGRHPYLFGGRPSLADFGLAAQLYQCASDPTAGAVIRERHPVVLRWIERMLDPEAEGEFATWDELESGLLPLFRGEIAPVFVPWTLANERALAAGEKTFSVDLEGEPFEQEVQKYHAKSLGMLRRRYSSLPDKARADRLLELTGCAALFS